MSNNDSKSDYRELSTRETLGDTQIFSNSLATSREYTEEEPNKDHNEDRMDADRDNSGNDNEDTVGWPHLEQALAVSLALSREPTPEPDSDVTSAYTDLAPGSPESDADYVSRTASQSLDTDRAVKRLKLDAPGKSSNNSTVDTSSGGPVEAGNSIDNTQLLNQLLVKTSYTKRVSSKSIEKLWVNLDKPALHSLLILFEMSMGKTIERFEGGNNDRLKVAECQRILTENWMSERLPRSFLARLNVTKLPPLKSLVLRVKGMARDDFDPLNIDQVNRQKGTFEALLLAEMKQLAGLEGYLKSLEDLFNLDSAYLRDFKKTVAAEETRILQEKEKFEKQFDLQARLLRLPDIKLRKPCTESVDTSALKHSRFDPNTDPEVKSLLEEINNKVVQNKLPMRELLDLCDDLDVIQRQTYLRRHKSSLS